MLSQLISTSERTTIPLDRIKTDGGTQMRATLDADTIKEYLDAMQPIGWGDFPAVIVYYDGKDHWLADGFHRVEAYRTAAAHLDQPANVPADVRSGTRRDAILHAAGANAAHGLRRTNADKRRSVETLLRDDDWRNWSNREIGRRCNVSESFVREVKKYLGIDTAHETQYIHPKTGEPTTMQTANIGAKPVETDEERRQRIRDNDRRMKDEINSRFASQTPARPQPASALIENSIDTLAWEARPTSPQARIDHMMDPTNFTYYRGNVQKRTGLQVSGATFNDAIMAVIADTRERNDVDAMPPAISNQDRPLPDWAADDPDPDRPPAQRPLTGKELCTALLGQAIVDVYNLPGSVRLILDNNQTITINGTALHFTIEEA